MGQHSAMMEEIKEQSKLLQSLFDNRKKLCKDFADLYGKQRFKKIIFVGNGSPYYAGCTLSFPAEKLLGAEALSIPAGVFHNHKVFDNSGKFAKEEILLVCPAESGHSKGQVDAARRAKELGICVMSTTLNPTGVLARTSDVVLEKPGKHEIAMAATKGQTMTLYMIFLNFLEASWQASNISREEYDRYLLACEKVPEHVEKTIKDAVDWFDKNEARVMAAQKYFLLGYGANYGTVQEAGLKFFECHGKPTVSLELEESLHGPLRTLHKTDMAFFLIAESGAERDRMQKLAKATQPYCDNRIMILSNQNAAKEDALIIHSSDVEFVNAIEYLIPLQVLSFLIADKMGIDLSIPLVASLDHDMLPAYED